MNEPEQWAVELWRDAQLASFNVLYGAVNKTKDRADRAAALAIQAAFAEREAPLVGALGAERTWHEEHDKAISKQPNANTGDNGWRRMEHQERIVAIDAALKEPTQ